MKGVRQALVVLLAAATLMPAVAQTRGTSSRSAGTTSWGKVWGYVFDAATGEPIVGAKVVLRQDGKFADSGKTVGVTNAQGRFEAQALVGRLSQNFDIARALNASLIGILTGGATNRTRRVDVTRLDVRVEAGGYKTFEGFCPCAALDPGKFSVRLEPILLAPQNDAHASGVAPGWAQVRLLRASVEPKVVRSGDNVTLRAEVRAPSASLDKSLKVQATGVLGNRSLGAGKETGRGVFLFEATARAPRVGTVTDGLITIRVTTSVGIVAEPDAVTSRILVCPHTADDEAVRLRAAAVSAENEGDRKAALERWRVVAESSGASAADCLRMADAASQALDYTAAAWALEKAASLAGNRERPELQARHAEALVRSGQASQAISFYGSLVADPKRSRAPGELSERLVVVLGEAYLATGDLAEAARMQKLLVDGNAPSTPHGIRFRNALRLAELRAAAEKWSNDPGTLAAYGRALVDAGRWEEAEPYLVRAVELDPKRTSLHGDLEYARMRLAHDEEDEAGAEAVTLEEARKKVVITDGKKERKSRDFHSWHALAMALLREAEAVRTSDSRKSAELVGECIEALKEAVLSGRAAARVDEGIFAGPLGFATPRIVQIAGYAYEEAALDYHLLQALQDLQREPADGLALLNQFDILVHLKQFEAAQRVAARIGTAWQDDPQYLIASGRLARARGQLEGARRALTRALTLWPWHSEARQLLARVCLETDDPEGAAAALAPDTLAETGRYAARRDGGWQP